MYLDLFDEFYLSSISNTADIKHVVKYNKDYLAYDNEFKLLGGTSQHLKLK